MSTVSAAFGTTTREDVESLDKVVARSCSEGGSTGLFGVGVKRCGRAVVASRVSKGKLL